VNLREIFRGFWESSVHLNDVCLTVSPLGRAVEHRRSVGWAMAGVMRRSTNTLVSCDSSIPIEYL
jgi:hypothetical protein